MKYKNEPEDLKFGIITNRSLIAVFENEIDRDDCLSFLAERYRDCAFTKINI